MQMFTVGDHATTTGTHMSDTNENQTAIKILMIEDEPNVLSSVSTYIDLHEEFEMVGGYGSVEAFLRTSAMDPALTGDIMLLDVGLPGVSGIDGIPKIKELLPELEIVMLTSYEEEDVVLKAICAGACSYLSKTSSLPEIVESIRVVAKGGSYMSPGVAREIVQYIMGGQVSKAETLTPRQKEILQALSEGKSYKAIAAELFISFETVRTHVKRIYRTLQVNNRSEAIVKYLRGQVK